jgi:hypothetical protein
MSRVRRVLSALGKPSAPGGASLRPEGGRGTPPAAPVPDGTDAADTARALRALTRQVAELRGLLHQQAAFTMEALQRAGYQTEEEAAQQAALQRALRAARGGGDVVAGPWTGEVGFELLYWIPFLGWLAEQGLDGRRLTVVSRGGAASWYAHLTTRYVDILDLVSAEEFRRRTEGPKKQVERRSEFDGELLGRAKAAAGVPDEAAVIHPSAMYRLFAALWRKRATVDLVESFTSHRRLTAPGPFTADERPAGLPADYVAAKFYFSKAFPDNTANRRFVAGVVQRVSAQAPLVLLSTSVRLDEHSDFQASGGSGVYVLDAHRVPQQNLDLQTRVLAASRGFVGTYGGFSYLAPFFGVRSLSFFSRRFGFESHHLDLANRVFDRLLPGGFLALDRRCADLVAPAVGAWMSGAPAADADDDEPAAAREPADALT